jgi:hypothetical protein
VSLHAGRPCDKRVSPTALGERGLSATLRALAVWVALASCRPATQQPTSAPEPASAISRPPAQRLFFEGAPVAVEARLGQPTTRDVHLAGTLAGKVRASILRAEGEVVKAEPLAAGGGRTAGIRLTLSGKRVGQGIGNVVVSTGLSDPKELALYYGWKVPGNLTVTPSNPYFNLRAPGRHVVGLTVASSRPDFRLLRAQVVDGPFAADVVPSSGGATTRTVEVRVVESRLSEQRGTLGKLILWSNDPAEPRKEIPLFALGAVVPSGAPNP